jgi:hypothetical protein
VGDNYGLPSNKKGPAWHGWQAKITLSSQCCRCLYSTKMIKGNIAQNKAAVMWPPIVDKSMQVIQIKSHEKVKIKRFWTFTSGWVEQ